MDADLAGIDLKYLSREKSRHGKTVYYARLNGKRIRIKAAEGAPEFIAEYSAAVASLREAGPRDKPPPREKMAPGTFEWLGEQYFRSPTFRALNAQSQRTRRAILEGCFAEPVRPDSSDRMGLCPIVRLEAKHIRRLRDYKVGLPGAANNRLKYLSSMFAWAVENEHMRANVARDVKSVKYRSDGFHSWTVEEVEKFERRWPIGSKPRLALALLMFTGARRSDIVQLGPQHIRDGWLKFTPQKTRASSGITLELPVLPDLLDVLNATPIGTKSFLMTEHGKPFSAAGFGNWLRDRCDEAGLPECTAHGIRKASAAIAANRGATDRQLMAIYGWTDAKQATTYTRKADQKRLASGAITLLARDEIANETVAPSQERTVAPRPRR